MSYSNGLNIWRVLQVVFSIIHMLYGVGLVSIGIWLVADPKLKNVENLVEVDTHYFSISSFVIIGVSIFTFLVGLFGCFGGTTKNRCLLGFYIFLLIIMFCGLTAAAIMTLICKFEVLKDVKEDLLQGLREEYRPGRAHYTRPWDYVQVSFECCGVNDHTDYRYAFPPNSTCRTNVPNSCCTLESSDPDDIRPLDEDQCQTEAATDAGGPNVKSKGCFNAIMDKINLYINILIGSTFELIGIEILCILVFSWLYWRDKRRIELN